MAAASKSSIRYQTKSISLPCRAHPTTLPIEELLNNIKTTAAAAGSRPSAKALCGGLSQLTGLYECMGDLLTSSTIRLLMSRQQNKKWVDELLDESLKFLDICGSTGDLLSQIKENARDLHSALRRRKRAGDLNIEKSITKYICFRKKMKKDGRRLVGSLNSMSGGSSVVVDSDSHHLAAAAVMKAVLGVSEMTISVLESLLVFLSTSIWKPKPKAKRWSLVVSKLMHKGMVGCEGEEKEGIANELESIDTAIALSREENVECRLERLGDEIEGMERGLEGLFRWLVRTRAALLNIISH